jgi:hypothetical protein
LPAASETEQPVASRQPPEAICLLQKNKIFSAYDKNPTDTVKNMVILQPKVCLTLLMKNNKWEKF